MKRCGVSSASMWLVPGRMMDDGSTPTTLRIITWDLVVVVVVVVWPRWWNLPCQPRFVARHSATAAAWLSRISHVWLAMQLGRYANLPMEIGGLSSRVKKAGKWCRIFLKWINISSWKILASVWYLQRYQENDMSYINKDNWLGIFLLLCWRTFQGILRSRRCGLCECRRVCLGRVVVLFLEGARLERLWIIDDGWWITILSSLWW